ncbi:hypothetical protein EfmAA708_02990 [Enterococcus faecium]|nr:hypothetical protein EfmAA708_02990 [Enterococcus faecium]
MTFVNIVDKTLSKFCGACSDTVSCKVIGTVKIELIITATSAESREYKIFCVNEKIHTKKEVPSVE